MCDLICAFGLEVLLDCWWSRGEALSEISLCGKTGGIAEAFSFSQLAQPTAGQPLSH